jgi:hypothetical protein
VNAAAKERVLVAAEVNAAAKERVLAAAISVA